MYIISHRTNTLRHPLTPSPACTGAPTQEQAASLLQRRVIYMEALSTAMRIPDAPLLPQPPPRSMGDPLGGQGDFSGDSQAPGVSDGVFLHCMSLHKGRSMLARALKLLQSPLASPEGRPLLVHASIKSSLMQLCQPGE